MNMVRSYKAKSVLIVLLLAGLFGCNAPSDNDDIQTAVVTEATPHMSENTDKIDVDILDNPSAALLEQEATARDQLQNEDTFDYDLYLRRIWVENDWNGRSDCFPFSFRITEINNGSFEGVFSSGGAAYPDFYYHRYDPKENNFTGEVSNGVAVGRYSNDKGDEWSITLAFRDSNRIEGNVHIIERNEDFADIYDRPSETNNTDEIILFRPHNVAYVFSDANIIEINSYEVELDSWGIVNLVTVLYSGRVWFSDAFLTTGRGDVVYRFRATISATMILDVLIEDVNGDGLKDIKLILGFIDYETSLILPDMPQLEWTFLQMDNGLFYTSNLDGEIAAALYHN